MGDVRCEIWDMGGEMGGVSLEGLGLGLRDGRWGTGWLSGLHLPALAYAGNIVVHPAWGASLDFQGIVGMLGIPQDFKALIVQPDSVGVVEPASIGILFIHTVSQGLIDPDIDPILAVAADAGRKAAQAGQVDRGALANEVQDGKLEFEQDRQDLGLIDGGAHGDEGRQVAHG